MDWNEFIVKQSNACLHINYYICQLLHSYIHTYIRKYTHIYTDADI